MAEKCKGHIDGGRQGLVDCYYHAARDGYCGIHHPDAVARRRAKSNEASRRWTEKIHRDCSVSAAEAAVVKAAEEWHAAEKAVNRMFDEPHLTHDERCRRDAVLDETEDALRSACRELAERRGNG